MPKKGQPLTAEQKAQMQAGRERAAAAKTQQEPSAAPDLGVVMQGLSQVTDSVTKLGDRLAQLESDESKRMAAIPRTIESQPDDVVVDTREIVASPVIDDEFPDTGADGVRVKRRVPIGVKTGRMSQASQNEYKQRFNQGDRVKLVPNAVIHGDAHKWDEVESVDPVTRRASKLRVPTEEYRTWADVLETEKNLQRLNPEMVGTVMDVPSFSEQWMSWNYRVHVEGLTRRRHPDTFFDFELELAS